MKTLIDSGINFKLLTRRLLNKQQRSLFKLQKARVIQVGNDSDLGEEDQHIPSADSADLDGARSRTITKTDLKEWQCQSFLDRQLLLGVFENKPELKIAAPEQ